MKLNLSSKQQAELHERVDESDYSLNDWHAALARFDVWLEKAGVSARPVSPMIGYVHCCSLTTPATLPAPVLADLVEAMLDEHGFDATAGADPAPDGSS